MADTRTLQNMVDRIASELSRDDLGTTGDNGVAAIQNAIRDAVYFYQPQAHFINEAITTTSTVAGQSTYNLPEDLVSLTQLDIIRYNTVYPLHLRRYQDLDRMDSLSPTPIQGAPEDYAIYDQQVRLFPTPDAVYSLRFIYYAAIPFPELTESNFWTTTAEEMIRARAKYGLNMSVIRDPGAAQLDKQIENEAFQAIVHQTTEKLHTGQIRSWEGP